MNTTENVTGLTPRQQRRIRELIRIGKEYQITITLTDNKTRLIWRDDKTGKIITEQPVSELT